MANWHVTDLHSVPSPTGSGPKDQGMQTMTYVLFVTDRYRRVGEATGGILETPGLADPDGAAGVSHARLAQRSNPWGGRGVTPTCRSRNVVGKPRPDAPGGPRPCGAACDTFVSGRRTAMPVPGAGGGIRSRRVNPCRGETAFCKGSGATDKTVSALPLVRGSAQPREASHRRCRMLGETWTADPFLRPSE